MIDSIARNLTDLRQSHGMSQEALANKLGISRQAVSRWERGEAAPDMDNLIALARIYGVSADSILGLSDEQRETPPESPQPAVKQPHRLIAALATACVALVLGIVALALYAFPGKQDGFIRGEIVDVIHPAGEYLSYELVVKDESESWGHPVYLVFTLPEDLEVLNEDGSDGDRYDIHEGQIIEARFAVSTHDVDDPAELPALIEPSEVHIIAS